MPICMYTHTHTHIYIYIYIYIRRPLARCLEPCFFFPLEKNTPPPTPPRGVQLPLLKGGPIGLRRSNIDLFLYLFLA